MQSPANETQGQFSPDGHWVAYTSDEEADQYQIFIQSFPAGAGKHQVSTTAGSTQPRWRRDGKELFYIGGDGKLMAVELKNAPRSEVGLPRALLDSAISMAGVSNSPIRYAVAADGKTISDANGFIQELGRGFNYRRDKLARRRQAMTSSVLIGDSMMRNVLLAFLMVAIGYRLYAQLPSKPESRAQRIGVLADLTWEDPNAGAFLHSFQRGLLRLGYTEGKNVHLETRIADRDPKRLTDAAAELAETADLIVTASSSAGKAAHEATSIIPIVGGGAEAVMTGNMTGFTGVAGHQKEFLIQLRTVVPKLTRVALLFDRSYYPVPNLLRATEDAARSLGLHVIHAEVHGANELAAAFDLMTRERAEAVLGLNHPLFRKERDAIAALAIQHKLPLSSPYREAGEAGALIAHEQDFDWIGEHVAAYADKILKGVHPVDLPVNRDAPFLLYMNLRTATAIGLTVPASLLRQAAEVFGRDSADIPLNMGIWKLNLAKSRYDAGPPPSSQTLTYEQSGNGQKLTNETVSAAGNSTIQRYTANYDGKDYPRDGSSYADTIALKRIDAYTVEETIKKGGKVVATVNQVVSKDGKTMTFVVTGTNADGKPVHNLQVYEKQ